MDICGDQALYLAEIECDDCKVLLQRLKALETQYQSLLEDFNNLSEQVEGIAEFIGGLDEVTIEKTNELGDKCIATVYGSEECIEKPRACSAIACESAIVCDEALVCEAKVCDSTLVCEEEI